MQPTRSQPLRFKLTCRPGTLQGMGENVLAAAGAFMERMASAGAPTASSVLSVSSVFADVGSRYGEDKDRDRDKDIRIKTDAQEERKTERKHRLTRRLTCYAGSWSCTRFGRRVRSTPPRWRAIWRSSAGRDARSQRFLPPSGSPCCSLGSWARPEPLSRDSPSPGTAASQRYASLS